MSEGNLARKVHEAPADKGDARDKKREETQEYKAALQKEHESSMEARAHHFITQAESANEAVDQLLSPDKKESTWSSFAKLRKHEIELNESLEMIMDQPSEEQDSPPMSKAILEVAKALSNVRQAIKTLEAGVLTSVQRGASDMEEAEIVSNDVTPKTFGSFTEGQVEENEFEEEEKHRTTEEPQSITPEELVGAVIDMDAKFNKRSHEAETLHNPIDREKRKELEAKKEAGKKTFEAITTEELVSLVDSDLIELDPDKQGEHDAKAVTTNNAETPIEQTENMIVVPANLTQTRTAFLSMGRLTGSLDERFKEGIGPNGFNELNEYARKISARSKAFKERLQRIEQMKSDEEISEEKSLIADALHLAEDSLHRIKEARLDKNTFIPRNNTEALEEILKAKRAKLVFLTKVSDDFTKLLEKTGMKHPEIAMSDQGIMHGIRRGLAFMTGGYKQPDEEEIRKIAERIANAQGTYLYKINNYSNNKEDEEQPNDLVDVRGSQNLRKIWKTLHEEIERLHDDLDGKALEGERSGTAKMNIRKANDTEAISARPEATPAKEKKKSIAKKPKKPQTESHQASKSEKPKDLAA